MLHALEVLRSIEADWIVASGSLPRGVPDDFDAQAAAIASQRGQNFVLVRRVRRSEPASACITLLKLSLGELEFLTGRELQGPQAREQEVLKLSGSGGRHDRGQSWPGRGTACDSDGVIQVPAVKVKNAVRSVPATAFSPAWSSDWTRPLPSPSIGPRYRGGSRRRFELWHSTGASGGRRHVLPRAVR